MARGNQGSYIFEDVPNKRNFLKLLEHGSKRFYADIFAFCIMGNHYHLLLRTREANLSSLMHFIGSSYASRLREQGQIGHIFSGRFKSVHVESARQALFVSRYIHVNPQRAGLVEHPEEYPWSSCMSHLLAQGHFNWVDRDFALGMLAPSETSARHIYQRFLEDPRGAGLQYPGFPDSVPLAKAIFSGERFAGEAEPGGSGQCISRPLEELYVRTCEMFKKKNLREGRTRSVSEDNACLLFVFTAREYLLASNDEIGRMLNGISPGSVSKYFKQASALLRENGPGPARLRRELDTIVEGLWP